MLQLLTYLLLPLATFAALALVLGYRFASTRTRRVGRWMGQRYWLSLAAVLLFIYALELVLDLYMVGPIDFVEATIASVSYLVVHGQPLYTDVADMNRYSYLYGPLCFLPYSLALKLFGSNLFSLKVAVVVFNVATFSVLWVVFRKLLNFEGTVVALSFLAAAFTMKAMFFLMIRGDILLGFTVALALLAISSRNKLVAILLLAIACACSVDIKITAPLYFLVPFYLLWRRWGYLSASVAVALTAGLALLPFSNRAISLAHYLAWLKEATHHPLSAKLLAMNLFAGSMLLLLPCLMLVRFYLADRSRASAYMRKNYLCGLVFLLSLCGTVLTGSKLGSGRNHLNSTFIVSAFLAACIWKETGEVQERLASLSSLVFTVYAMFFVIPALSQVEAVWQICVQGRTHELAVDTDIDSILQRHPHRLVEMGYDNDQSGGDQLSELTNYRYELVFKGNPLTVDAGALFDMGLSGLKIPPATVDYIHSCKTAIWLVPKGKIPFDTLNGFASDAPTHFKDGNALFSASFRQAFFDRYEKTESSEFYDLWMCK